MTNGMQRLPCVWIETQRCGNRALLEDRLHPRQISNDTGIFGIAVTTDGAVAGAAAGQNGTVRSS